MRKGLLIASILLILLPCALLAGLLYTEAGLGLIVGQLERLELERHGIRLEGVSGTVAGPLRVARFELDHPRVGIISHDIVMDLQLRGLVLQTLRTASLEARDTEVVLREPQSPPSGRPPRFLPPYLRIDARGVDLKNVRYEHVNGVSVDAGRVQGNVMISARQIDVKNARIGAGRFDAARQFDASGQMRLRTGSPLIMRVMAQGRLRMQRGVEYAVEGLLDGPLDRLMIQGAVQTASGTLGVPTTSATPGTSRMAHTPDSPTADVALQGGHTQASVDLLLTRPEGRWRIAGQLRSDDFAFDPWLDRPPFSLSGAELQIEANPDGIRVDGTMAIPEYDSGAIEVHATGRYARRELHIESADLNLVGSATKVHAAGRIAFTNDGPSLDLAARWQALQWPLRTEAVVVSPQGNASLRGIVPYDFALTAAIESPRVPAARGSVHGILSARDVRIEHYDIATLEGLLSGTAYLEFAQPRPWRVSAQATGIDPAALHAEFPGQLNAQMQASGTGLDKQASFTVQVDRLAGHLRSQSLRAHGEISRDRRGWTLRDTDVAFADARLTVDAELRGKLDARWSLHAPRLDKLLPHARGSIDFSGSVRGSLAAPQLQARAQAMGLEYAGWRARAFDLDVAIDTAVTAVPGTDGSAPQGIGHAPDHDPDHSPEKQAGKPGQDEHDEQAGRPVPPATGGGASHLRLSARGLGREQTIIERIDVDSEGTLDAHRIDIDLDGVAANAQALPPHASMHIDGRYQDQRWDALLTTTRLSIGTSQESVSIAEPARISASAEHATLSDLCLIVGAGRLCANGSWQRNGPWESTVAGYEIPLSLLPPGAQEATYDGRIEGRMRAFGSPGQPWQAEAGMRIIDAAIVYHPQSGETETLHLGTGGLGATMTPQRIDFSFGLQAFTDTYLYANAQLLRDGLPLARMPLTADIRARAADANILPLFFPEIDHAAGVFAANMDVRGTLAQPAFTGRLSLDNGEFDSYRINLSLRDLKLIADLQGNALELHGTGRAGDGHLNVEGKLAWQDGESSGNLYLKGDQLLVADLPEYRVVAAPDLHFRIDGRRIGVTGEVTIPSARLQPVQLGGAVRVSDDARYVGEHPAEQAGRYEVRSEVRISMGDDVRIDAFGLQGRITGAVSTTVHTGEPPTGRGELAVDDGRYEAYGQKLAINRGRLLFDASSLDDPGLDIEARRDVDHVIVGLNVRGTLREPRLTFFSDPSMPQTQIVSYLLTGKSIDATRSGDRMTLDSARNTLAFQGGGLLASQLGRHLGIEEMGVESTVDSAGENNTSLVLGKFLSPRMFISYGISLTESINTLKLRYTISDRWILRTEAGETQSADLEYTIER